LKIFWLQYFAHNFFLKNDNRFLEEVPESLEKDGFNEHYNEALLAWLHPMRSLNFQVL